MSDEIEFDIIELARRMRRAPAPPPENVFMTRDFICPQCGDGFSACVPIILNRTAEVLCGPACGEARRVVDDE